jgi:hypothetical protein
VLPPIDQLQIISLWHSIDGSFPGRVVWVLVFVLVLQDYSPNALCLLPYLEFCALSFGVTEESSELASVKFNGDEQQQILSVLELLRELNEYLSDTVQELHKDRGLLWVTGFAIEDACAL